jgi:D-alanyl-D-alanine carboxypeptidase/D-alanyl-D-alanine-endopeptidase (penicillin-binding protein 4)
MMNKLISFIKILIISIFCVCFISSFNHDLNQNRNAGVIYLPPTPDILELRSRIDDILQQFEDTDYVIGLSIISMDVPQIFYEREVDRPLTPASNLKVITTAVALETFGPDFRWATDFFVSDTGNLYIRASGDPTWNDLWQRGSINHLFRSITDSLRSNGINTVFGDVIIDPGTFSDFQLGIGWRETNRIETYSAFSSALAFNENTVQAMIRPTNAGQRANITLTPTDAGFHIVNNVTTVAERNNTGLSFLTEENTNTVRISGRIWERSRPQYRSFSTPLPAEYALHLFGYKLYEHGILVNGEIRYHRFIEDNPTLSNFQKIFTIESVAFQSVLDEINKRSNNFMSNQLFLTIGDTYNDAGNTESIIKQWLNSQNIVADSLLMFDGSGLSYENRCSAALLTYVLKVMYESDNFEVFQNSLAISGVDGTLRNVFRCDILINRVYAKTGFILGVRGLTGYINTADEEMLGFSLIINREGSRIRNFNRIAEQILLELATFTREDSSFSRN